MDIQSYVNRAMKILSRYKNEKLIISQYNTISTTDLEKILHKIIREDPIYWKNLEERQLSEILGVIENILSAKINKQRALAIFNFNDIDIKLTTIPVICISHVYETEPDYEPNSLFRFDIMKLKKNEKTFFCVSDYYKKIPIKIAIMLINFGELSSVEEP